MVSQGIVSFRCNGKAFDGEYFNGGGVFGCKERALAMAED